MRASPPRLCASPTAGHAGRRPWSGRRPGSAQDPPVIRVHHVQVIAHESPQPGDLIHHTQVEATVHAGILTQRGGEHMHGSLRRPTMPEHGIRGVDLIQGAQTQQGGDSRRTGSEAGSQDCPAQLRQGASIGQAHLGEGALDDAHRAGGL